MSKKPNRPHSSRTGDEVQAVHGVPATAAPRSAGQTLHDFEEQQAELEMRGEILRQTLFALEESHDRYVDLYDFAPVGLFTLTSEATISEINLTGAALLGDERKELLNRHFEQFIVPEDSGRWRRHFLGALKKNGTHSCELVIQRGDGFRFHAKLYCLCIKADGRPQVVRVALTDISERKQIEIELREHQQALRDLAAQDAKLREAEYKHLAREVHDELGQILTAVRMDISLLRIQFGKRDPVLMKRIKEILALLDNAIRGVRNTAVNLRPAALDMGIVSAIAWLCDKFPNRTDTACTLRVIENPVGLDDVCTAAIFRIVQESLTNVARYAAADSVEITIGKEGDDVIVEVRDDGKGFVPSALSAKESFGLLGMRERALTVGGKVEITSMPSRGTVVSVRIPTKPVESIL